MNGLLLTLPVALPFTAGLLSYFIRFPSKRAQNLWYGGIICLTTALAWLAILLVGEERVTLLHFTDTLTIALRCDGAARLFAALSATLWPFTATNTSPLYLSLSLNSRTETSSSPASTGASAWASAAAWAAACFVFASLMVTTSRSQELKVEQVSMRIIYCSTSRSATFVAFHTSVAL